MARLWLVLDIACFLDYSLKYSDYPSSNSLWESQRMPNMKAIASEAGGRPGEALQDVGGGLGQTVLGCV